MEIAEINERVAVLNRGEGTMDTTEYLFRCVLQAIASGSFNNPGELAAAALAER
jgi:hypothetical protein